MRTALPLLRRLVWVTLIVAAVPARTDPDLWGTLRFGLDQLAGLDIFPNDLYSFTQDQPWMNHDWLFQALSAWIYAHGGTLALVAAKASLVLGALWVTSRVLQPMPPLVADGLVALAMWGALPLTVTIRAQVISFAALPVLWVLLTAHRRALRFLAIPLFVVWANSHIAWVLGFGYLAVWAAGEIRTGERRRLLDALLIAAGCAAAVTVNPFGVGLWSFAIRMSHVGRGISEWQPLWTSPVVNWLPWMAGVGIIIAATVKRRLALERLAFLAALALLALRVLKFTPFFAESVVLLAAPALFQRARSAAGAPVPAGIAALNTVAAAVVLAVGLAGVLPAANCLTMGDWRPDAAVARALIARQPAGRIAVYFDWGEYVIWHLGPALKVSFDPRYDLLYSPAVIREQEAVDRGLPDGREFLAAARPDYVWFPQTRSQLKQVVTELGYRIDIDTPESFLAVRPDLPLVTVTAQNGALPRCFPSP